MGETAQQLAGALLPHLEALANLHYLMDAHITNPRRLRELRVLEDQVFEEVIKCVRAALPSET